MKNYQDRRVIIRGYKSAEDRKTGFPSVETPPIQNTEEALQRAIQEYGLDNSAELKVVTIANARG